MPARVQKLMDGVELETRPSDDGLKHKIRVLSQTSTHYELTFDYSKSSNVSFADGNMVVTVDLPPNEKASVGTLSVMNPAQGYSMGFKMAGKVIPPDPAKLNADIEEAQAKLDEHLRKAESLDFGADSATIADIDALCEKHGMHFIDVEFPPAQSSLYLPLGMEGETNRPKGGKQTVAWRKASEIFKGDYALFMDGVSPSDILQGGLGDCWFMCGLSALAEESDRVTRLFTEADPAMSRTFSETGVYRIKVCKNGEWQTVRLDDYFPCSPGAGPSYGRNRGNELWVMLLEKCFAKLHGCYDAMISGRAADAFTDLTGCPTETFHFEQPSVAEEIKSGAFFDRLMKADEQGCIIAASTPGVDTWTAAGTRPEDGPGIVAGHAYTVLQARKANGHRLLQLRNPWGSFEWKGDWSDQSPLWTPALRRILGIEDDKPADDGAFWMSFDDFVKYYDSSEVCYIGPSRGRNWEEARRKGRFTVVDGKVLSSSSFTLKVTTPGPVWITLHQEDQRVIGAEEYIDAGVLVLREKAGGGYDIIDSTDAPGLRETVLRIPDMKPGKYIIVPSTSGVQLKNRASKPDPPTKIDLSDGKDQFSPACEAALRRAFESLDEDMDGFLNRRELDGYSKMTQGKAMSDAVYKWMVKTFDSNGDGISADGFVEAYHYLWAASKFDQTLLWKDLNVLGYDNDLDRTKMSTFVISVHSVGALRMEKVPFDSSIVSSLALRRVMDLGEKSEKGSPPMLRIYTLTGKRTAGISVAAENISSSPFRLTLDCSGCQNLTSPDGKTKGVVDLEPSGSSLVLALMPADITKGWSFGYKIGLMPL